MARYEFQQRQWQWQPISEEQLQVWANAEPHRQQLTGILLGLAQDLPEQPADRLAVLGAGPCIDLNLPALNPTFRLVHLFDLDGPAVWEGVDRQRLSGADWIRIHGDLDVSGVKSEMDSYRDRGERPDGPALDRLIERARDFRLQSFSGQFDVVASTCLLSQLIEHAVEVLGEQHPRLVDFIKALRLGHLLMLRDLCRPGGRAVLITDFVSSLSLPEIATAQGEELNRAIQQAIAQQNFFHGLNPLVLSELIHQDAEFAPQVTDQAGSKPWVWNATARQYAVVAYKFRRA